jgi:hypothetical protein
MLVKEEPEEETKEIIFSVLQSSTCGMRDPLARYPARHTFIYKIIFFLGISKEKTNLC